MTKLRSGRLVLAPIAFLITTTLMVTLVRGQAPNRTATKFYPDFSDTADALLRNASSHVRDGQWAEAVEIYQKVIQQYGDKVAKLPKDDEASDPTGESVLYVDLRQFCQRRLASLPAPARAIYRGRVDAQAERWYRQGSADRDRSLLRRIVEQAFCSSWGDDALELLGDLAFEDGRFEEALGSYRQLVPDHPEGHSALVHPDPSVDLARVAAKKFLCRAAMGEPPPNRAMLDAFAQAYPNAAGALAGRTGPYRDTLTQALASDRLAPPSQPDGRWPTFAGSPMRTKVVPGNVDVGSMQWRVALPPCQDPTRRTEIGFPRRMGTPPKVSDERLLCYHPIILGDQVIVATENKLLAYNLNDRPEGTAGDAQGAVKPVWEAPPENQEKTEAIATSPALPVPRYTLTAYGDRIYARLGPANPPFFMMPPRAIGPSQSRILAVDRSTEGKVLWQKMAGDVTIPRRPADGLNRTGFEGTPVADARSVYVAMTDRREQTATYVTCLDSETGKTRWVRYLGAASTDADNPMGFGMGFGGVGGFATLSSDFSHRLLTLDGPTLYYQTNLGAVVALDAETGSIRWVATYARQDRSEGGARHSRDLNPAIVHNGLVFVAPDDAASIYAFDAASGRLVWKTEPIPAEVKLAHVLGVAGDRLVATGDRVLLFDVKTGKPAGQWPDSGHAFEGFGRGLLAGDRIYWPTRGEIHILDQKTGLVADRPIKLQDAYQTTGGNLAVGDGYLIVAQAEALIVFCQNSRLIQRYREEIAQNPEHASSFFRLAQAAEATGRDDLALESLAMTLAKVRPSETIDGVPLADAARDHQYRLLMRLGNKARSAQDWKVAAGRYEAAAAAARIDRDRLAARLLLAEVALEEGTPRSSVVILQELLGDQRVRRLNVAADDGHRTIRADLLIGDRLSTILRKHGRTLYRDFDLEAWRLLEKGQNEQSPRLLEEVGRSYPVAEAVPDALLALGRLCDGLKRPADAAHAYKRLLVAATSDGQRARALLGLARAYEEQRLWVLARDTYHEALARFANMRIDELGPDARLASLVSERLSREPFIRMNADRAEAGLPVPLVRRWGRVLPETLRPLAAAGIPPSARAGRIFLVQGTTLIAIDPSSGATRWSAELGGSPIWVGYMTDKIVAATESRLTALSLEKGACQWQYEPSGPHHGRAALNPFARADHDANAAAADSGPFHGFQIVGNRLFCLRGERELLAVDGDSGLIDWSFTPGAGSLNPLLSIGPRRIVLEVLKPSEVLVLETATGRRHAGFPHKDDEGWVRAPLPIDDDHVVLVRDPRTVALFDLRAGVNSWEFCESRNLPKNGSPRLLGNAERLLVIHDGTELIRLDAATGTKLWGRPLGAEDLSKRPEAAVLDGERIYWASDRSLSAASLADGSLAWSKHLTGPDAGWSLALTERCVLAFPTYAIPPSSDGETLPLVFRRRDTGALVQRLIFPVAVADVTVQLAPRGALVATREGFWAVGERKVVDPAGSPQ